MGEAVVPAGRGLVLGQVRWNLHVTTDKDMPLEQASASM